MEPNGVGDFFSTKTPIQRNRHMIIKSLNFKIAKQFFKNRKTMMIADMTSNRDCQPRILKADRKAEELKQNGSEKELLTHLRSEAACKFISP